jgi:8-oxo-dGTP pyrophosphatase MutT (NUDIX family)
MTNAGSPNSAYSALLAYFSEPSATLNPINHPDKAVNIEANRDKHLYRKAAVLLPITRLSGNFQSELVLTVRSANLRSHAGQISLPGGTKEDQDPDFETTALRESEEEIGLRRDQVEVIGKLGDMALPSGFQITPFVGLIDNQLAFTPSPDEVADIFQAPLELILDPSAYRHSTMFFNSSEREILELMFEDYRIWGATAAILYHLATEVEKYR